MSLKECTVSMVGQDGQTYETTVEASSLFDAAGPRAAAMGAAVVVSPKRIRREPKRRFAFCVIISRVTFLP